MNVSRPTACHHHYYCQSRYRQVVASLEFAGRQPPGFLLTSDLPGGVRGRTRSMSEIFAGRRGPASLDRLLWLCARCCRTSS